MSKEIAIDIKKVSKSYKIYNKPYHRLLEMFRVGNMFIKINALDGISFNVPKGRTIGIVGPNGSGKSTLLQIITGILQPSSGNVTVNGRISALLELGAGFNPEYTGRENIYLYASILGVNKEEIDQRLDAIIDFAQIGDFVDRAVKTYSSGMYVRLAFAVAINVQPDILIVDEALAVGDESFQRKCFRKFEELKETGVTILFVTHSLGLVKQFCDEAIFIFKGKLIEQGHPNQVINTYTKYIAEIENSIQNKTVIDVIDSQESMTVDLSSNSEYRYGNGHGKIKSFQVKGENENLSRIFRQGEKITISVEVEYLKESTNSIVAYTIKSVSGVEVTGTNTQYEDINLGHRFSGDLLTIEFIQHTMLNAGDYVFSFGFVEAIDENIIVFDRRYDAVTIKVAENKKAAGFVDPNVTVRIKNPQNSE